MRTVERIMSDIESVKVTCDAIVSGLNKELKAACEAEEAAKNAPWVPKAGERYYSVDGCGRVFESVNDGYLDIDKDRIARHNAFRTREEAEADEERRTVTNLLREAATKAGRKNGEFVANATNWILLFNRVRGGIGYNAYSVYEYPNSVYFPSLESLKSAISEIGEDRIKRALFGVDA